MASTGYWLLTTDYSFLEREHHSTSLSVIKAGEVNAMTLALTVLFAVNLYARAGRSR
jgi:hypothetical protein